MSAYLLDPQDFARLSQYFMNAQNCSIPGAPSLLFYNMHTRQPITGRKGGELRDVDLPLILAVENLASVSHRYPHEQYGGFLDDDGGTGESVAEFLGSCAEYFRHPLQLLTHAEAWDMCARYEYQSCEHPEYWQSNAAAILDRIRNKAGSGMRNDAIPEVQGWAA